MEHNQGNSSRVRQRLARFPSTLIIVSLLILVLPGLVHSTPSGQTTSIEGGGFCQGTYTIYNNTAVASTPGLFAMNCQTGVNDCFNAADLGALMSNCVIPNEANGGLDFIRVGYYSVVTPIVFTKNTCAGNSKICDVGITIQGVNAASTPGTFVNNQNENGTVLIAKTSNMTMIESTPTPTLNGITVRRAEVKDLTLQSNCVAFSGVNLSGTEVGGTGNLLYNVFFTNPGGACATPFTIAAVMDGNEDSLVSFCSFDGDGKIADKSSLTDLQWQAPGGDIDIFKTYFAGQTNLAFRSQITSVTQSTISSVKQIGQGSSSTSIISFVQDYMANQPAAGGTYGAGRFQINGFTTNIARFDSDFILTSSTLAFFSGTGSITNWSTSGSAWYFLGSTTWNPNAATITKSNTGGDNHVSVGTAPAGFPFTVDGNGNF